MGRSKTVLSVSEWDTRLIVGSFVTILNEPPHVYVVRELNRRFVATHDLYNHPSLGLAGVKDGDEMAPSLGLIRVREAYNFAPLPPGKTYHRRVDADQVRMVLCGDIQLVIQNLVSLEKEVLAIHPYSEEHDDDKV